MCFDLIYLDDYAEKCGTHFEHRTSKGVWKSRKPESVIGTGMGTGTGTGTGNSNVKGNRYKNRDTIDFKLF